MLAFNRKVLTFVIVIVVSFGALAICTEHVNAASVATIAEDTSIEFTSETFNNLEYIKFKPNHSGELILHMYLRIDEEEGYDWCEMSPMYKVYIKKDGIYKEIGHLDNSCGCGPVLNKDKIYYIKILDSSIDAEEVLELNAEIIRAKDGGYKRSKAKSMRYDSYLGVHTGDGYFTYYDGADDWYKIKLKKGKTVKLQIYQRSVYKSGKYSVTVYKGKKKIKTYKFSATKSSHRTKTLKLKKGTYYIKVKRLSKQFNMLYSVGIMKPSVNWGHGEYEDAVPDEE